MDKNKKFFEEFKNSPLKKTLEKNPVAFFCAEYALTTSIPTYAGGLGVLAGDFIHEAADQDFPLVAVGIYYNDGYETLHHVDQKGYIEEPHVHHIPENLGLEALLDENGQRLLISVPIRNKTIFAQVWLWHIKNVKLFLLDTNVEKNSPSDRKITDHLYVIDKETRIAQEVVLGIGGFRLLKTQGVTPSVFHMNEGHSAFLSLELIRSEMQEKNLNFSQAAEEIKKKIVFTNHTLVPAGNEVFSADLAELTLSCFAKEMGVEPKNIMELGKAKNSEEFSLTNLSFHLASKSNAVSQIHAQSAAKIWPESPMIPITNGIHIPTWNAIPEDSDLWKGHQSNKKELLQAIHLASGQVWKEDELLIGWARRFVSYKRPMALLDDLTRLLSIAKKEDRPVRIVYSGTLHPSDIEGTRGLEKLHGLVEKELRGVAVYLSGYNIELAKLLVAGCDVWLNTPIVGNEACGTSGMKAALNGSLPLSTKDGWMADIDFYGIGWALDDEKITESILDTLENEIIPLYYRRHENNEPFHWIQSMQNSRSLIQEKYSTTRMLSEYIEKLYSPLINNDNPSL